MTTTDLDQLEAIIKNGRLRFRDGDWKAENYGTWISAPSLRGGYAHVADVRGWGYLTGLGHGALGLSEDVALAQQTKWGELIVAAVNALPSLISTARRVEEVERAKRMSDVDTETLCDLLNQATERAKKAEAERDEARAEVERLKAAAEKILVASARASERLHSLPRASDTELYQRLTGTRIELAAALGRKL